MSGVNGEEGGHVIYRLSSGLNRTGNGRGKRGRGRINSAEDEEILHENRVHPHQTASSMIYYYCFRSEIYMMHPVAASCVMRVSCWVQGTTRYIQVS